MKIFDEIEHLEEKKFAQKDKKKRKRMRVTGKSVFTLQKLLAKPHDSLSKRKNPKKNR